MLGIIERARNYSISNEIKNLADEDPGTRAMAGATLQNFGASALEPYIPYLVGSLGSAEAKAFAAIVPVGIGKPAVGSLTKAVSDERKREMASAVLQEIAKKDDTVQIPTAVSQKPGPVLIPVSSQSLKSKFCKYCGAPLTPESAFCSQCGKKIE